MLSNLKHRILFHVAFWVALSLLGAFPCLLFGYSFTDALFESVSAVTATGTSFHSHAQALPWRAATQWLSGISFIILALVIVSPPQKLHPRRKTTITCLCLTYILLTAAQTAALRWAGMSLLDALSYSFSTISTGGFNAGAIQNQPATQYILTTFMLLAGINYTLYISHFLRRFAKDEELRFYIALTLIAAAIIALALFFSANINAPDSLRTALFQAAGIISTTGFYATGEMQQIPLLQLLFIPLLLLGASSGSAGGGVKIKRIALLLKSSYSSFRRFIHPSALRTVFFDSKPTPLTPVNNAFLFILLYTLIALTGTLLLLIHLPLRDAATLVLTSLGNIGCTTPPPALPTAAKYVLMLLMIAGRVEIFALLALFSREFWRK